MVYFEQEEILWHPLLLEDTSVILAGPVDKVA